MTEPIDYRPWIAGLAIMSFSALIVILAKLSYLVDVLERLVEAVRGPKQ